jgi:hypothetical protein
VNFVNECTNIGMEMHAGQLMDEASHVASNRLKFRVRERDSLAEDTRQHDGEFRNMSS